MTSQANILAKIFLNQSRSVRVSKIADKDLSVKTKYFFMNFYGITKGILLEVPHLTDPLNEVLTFLLSQLHGISGFF